jgi:hypothetical protein
MLNRDQRDVIDALDAAGIDVRSSQRPAEQNRFPVRIFRRTLQLSVVLAVCGALVFVASPSSWWPASLKHVRAARSLTSGQKLKAGDLQLSYGLKTELIGVGNSMLAMVPLSPITKGATVSSELLTEPIERTEAKAVVSIVAKSTAVPPELSVGDSVTVVDRLGRNFVGGRGQVISFEFSIETVRISLQVEEDEASRFVLTEGYATAVFIGAS